jgi:hypothetical protein
LSFPVRSLSLPFKLHCEAFAKRDNVLRCGLDILTAANSENLSTRLVFFTASVEDRELVMLAASGA